MWWHFWNEKKSKQKRSWNLLTFEVLSDDGELRWSDHELVDGVRVGGDVVQVNEVRRVRVEDVVAQRCLFYTWQSAPENASEFCRTRNLTNDLTMMSLDTELDVGRCSPWHLVAHTSVYPLLGSGVFDPLLFKLSMNSWGFDLGPLCLRILTPLITESDLELYLISFKTSKLNKSIEYWVQYTDCIFHWKLLNEE